ncbi:MAG: quinone oxidoreductase [Alphaproteobacteria bacterium]|nr:quinone oxidoreductase [Alphaproteobacteria bacterium]
MVNAIRIHEHGPADKMRWEPIDGGKPGAGEIRLRQTAVGVNFIDVYMRSGVRPMPLPAIIGMEAAGIVEEVGPGVSGLAVGDHAAYTEPVGSYTEARVMPARTVVKLPKTIDDKVAAAMMLKGMTAQFLCRRTFRVEKGQTVLLHAAAGGVGLILSQWLNHLGATVIGTAGGKEKTALARAHGCHHVIDYRTENFVERVKELTGGKGVPVVYDGVGKATLTDSLKCLHRLGMLVSFGNASGVPDPIAGGQLAAGGSLFFTRPMLFDYSATREELEATAADLFDVVAKGAVKIEINQTYPLREAARAHADLEARRTTGSTVLLP